MNAWNEPKDRGKMWDRRSSCGIIIPTFNAARYWPDLHEGLLRQGIDREQVLIVDSTSSDGTDSLAREAGYRLVVNPSASFRHGRTRQMAADLLPEAEYLVYLTQDAIPYDGHSLANLLESFEDSCVGAAYGRQLARPQANAIERHGRLFNYPPRSAITDFASRTSLGFRSAYFSNSFAAYRRTAFEEVGGFPGHVIASEDVSAAARMLLNGWKIRYRSEAKVIHSHDLSLFAEFSRYFDISIHHQQENWIIEQFGSVGGEGLKFVLSELRYLAKNSPQLIPLALLRSAAKWTAYQCGRRESLLPLWIKRNLSLQPAYWTSEEGLLTAQKAFGHLVKGAPPVKGHPSPESGPTIR